MIKMETFRDIIVERVKEFLPPLFQEFEIEVLNVPKTNGIKEAIVIHYVCSDVVFTSPNIYVDEFYKMLCDENEKNTIEDVLQNIANLVIAYTSSYDPKDMNLGPDFTKDKIIKVLINKEINKGLLKDVPHKEFLDLAVIYKCVIEEDDGLKIALISNDFLKQLSITSEELDSWAEENAKDFAKYERIRMGPDFNMVTNRLHYGGATNMMNVELLESIADEMDSDLYLLPSSIHEIMVVKYDPENGPSAENLKKMLLEGNRTVCDDDEFLSDNIYFFDRNSKKVAKVA